MNLDFSTLQLNSLLAGLRRRESEMLRLLGRFVRAESPSREKAAVDCFARIVAGEWRKRRAKVQIIEEREAGNHVRAEVWNEHGRPRGQILVLGHLDTVYPLGTLERMPFRVKQGRAWGPGAFDMKGGLVLALFAADALRRAGAPMRKRLVFLWTSDEEIGSYSSRQIIEREGKRSDAVLVLEPALGTKGKLKTRRKGVGEAELIVHGRSAHAGINPENGVNAVHELALQIARLMHWNDRSRGITVQANVVSGGTTGNVVPDFARAEIDLRVAFAADIRNLEARIRALRPILAGARVEFRGGINRPPLGRSAGVQRLFQAAQKVAAGMGVHLDESATGGGSDGNFTAALGIATLDGLGAIGEGAHSPRENVLIRALPLRAALLAGLLANLQNE